jgi:hypothetical protein
MQDLVLDVGDLGDAPDGAAMVIRVGATTPSRGTRSHTCPATER